MKKYYAIISLALFLSTNCKDFKTNKTRIFDAPINVEITSTADTLKLSDYFQHCDYLELKGQLLADISDVKQANDLFFIQSKVQGKDIHIFDETGNYIRSLIRYGRANNEVLNMQAFCYNKHLGTVDVLCNYGMEIKQYSIDGESYQTIPLPQESIISAKDIEILDDSTYVLYKDVGFTDSLEYKLYFYDYKKQSVINTFIPLDRNIEEKISFSQNNNLFFNNGNLYFYEVFQNGIFEVGDEDIKPYVAFVKNSYTFPSGDFLICKDEMDLIRHCQESNYIWAHVNCIQCDNLIFSFFTYNKNIYGNVINTNTKDAHSYLYLQDDLFSNSITTINMLNVIGSDRGRLLCNFRYNEKMLETQSYLLFLHN